MPSTMYEQVSSGATGSWTVIPQQRCAGVVGVRQMGPGVWIGPELSQQVPWRGLKPPPEARWRVTQSVSHYSYGQGKSSSGKLRGGGGQGLGLGPDHPGAKRHVCRGWSLPRPGGRQASILSSRVVI